MTNSSLHLQQGSLVCVGPGMTLGAHMSARCRSHIEHAQVVFTNCHPLMEAWISTMNADVRSLQHLYEEGKDRRDTYQEMIALIMEQLRLNKRVVGAFYGHPGVFAQVPHHAIAQARKEGFSASMEPGISAEDCLYADLGIDPGAFGCQHFETSQFMIYQRQLDTAGYLILWQVALAGDLSISKRVSSSAQRRVLLDLLLEHYPAEHEVILYECPTLITDTVRQDRVRLDTLADIALSPVTTLVLPPAQRLVRNQRVIDKLMQL